MNQEGQTLHEYVHSRDAAIHVDREQGIIRGVKVLGMNSRNGRHYLPEALQEAAGFYEGAKVNVNHPKGDPASPRDYQDRLGEIRNVLFRENVGLFADLHFNPRHALAEQLMWDAEHSPGNVGFSHNVRAITERENGKIVVKKITWVNSVDLVADPATTTGLYESLDVSERQDALQDELTAVKAQLTEMKGLMEEIRTSREDVKTHQPPRSREQYAGVSGSASTRDFVKSILR